MPSSPSCDKPSASSGVVAICPRNMFWRDHAETGLGEAIGIRDHVLVQPPPRVERDDADPRSLGDAHVRSGSLGADRQQFEVSHNASSSGIARSVTGVASRTPPHHSGCLGKLVPPMTIASRTDTPASGHVADSHDLIRVQGARENNLKNVTVELPKRRLTVFTGVSGSGKSSLVFDTIAAESQRMINETYSTFVQNFMPALARPDVDVLEGLTTAIIVDQERMGANVRSTVGTATDANAMLRILFSRLGEPHIGPPTAYSFNVPMRKASGAMTIERGGGERQVVRNAIYHGGMCARCEGMGSITDMDLTQLYDADKSLREGALTIPGYSMDGWYGRIFMGSGFFDPDKPIRDYSKTELHDLLHKEPTKIRVEGINLTYEGLIPRIQRSMLSKDVDTLQPHIRAFVERAVTFTTCPDCDGTRLNEPARSSRIAGINIAEACAMQIDELAEWLRGLDERGVAPLLAGLQHTFDSFVEIGLGYLSLDRPSGTLSGGESQRTRMIRHLGSSLTDVTYVFDEPTIGLHPH